LLLQIAEGLRSHEKAVCDIRAQIEGVKVLLPSDVESVLRFHVAKDLQSRIELDSSKKILDSLDALIQRLRESQHS
jgi:hypothetical protein